MSSRAALGSRHRLIKAKTLAQRLEALREALAADCRAAISRAYYAAFNVGAELLRGCGFPVGRGAGAHGDAMADAGSTGK